MALNLAAGLRVIRAGVDQPGAGGGDNPVTLASLQRCECRSGSKPNCYQPVTSAGTPNPSNARVIAAIAPAAFSTSQARAATSSRLQSSRTSKTTAFAPPASSTSVASIW